MNHAAMRDETVNPLLEARDLSAWYDTDSGRRAVFRNLEVTVERGTFMTILGPSGCGKTTLLKILGGFRPPDEGTVLHEGIPVTGPQRSRIMIFQEFLQLFPWMTVLGNTAFPLKMAGMPRKERETLARNYIHRVGLSGYEDVYPRELSGGMKQRIALARALVTGPDILLMDEPFASLDTPGRNNLRNLLLDLWQAFRFSVIFVTHDIPEALKLSNTIFLLGGGKGEIIPLSLPYPRDEGSEEFKKIHRELYESISAF